MSLLGRKSRSNTATSQPQNLAQLDNLPPPPPIPRSPQPGTQTASPEPSASNGNRSPSPQGRRSFTFLRRTKSGEPASGGRSNVASSGSVKRNVSNGKIISNRKQKVLAREEEARQQRELANRIPRIPSQLLPNNQITPFTSQTNLYAAYSASPASATSHDQGGRYNYSSHSYNSNAASFAQRRAMETSHISPPPTVPVPPIPVSGGAQSANGTPVDPYSRSQSMTHRGRHSYASSAISSIDSPRRVRRRNDPTPFNILVIGAKSCGKTSFIEFMRTALAIPFRKRPNTPSQPPPIQIDPNSPFTSHYLETELEGERIGLTIYDSKGLEAHLVDIQLRELSAFVESKFQETFNEEQKVVRTAGVLDTHIHCVILLLDPARLDANVASQSASPSRAPTANYPSKSRVVGGLDESLDVGVMRMLQGKTVVLPVISKADTITTSHMTFLKRVVWDSLRKVKINPLEALSIEDDSEESEPDTPTESRHNRKVSSVAELDEGNEDNLDESAVDDSTANNSMTFGTPPERPEIPSLQPPQHAEIRYSALSENVDLPDIPLSIISPDRYDPGVIGRRFPWGFADPYNPEHCDFLKLKDSVFSEWRSELRSASREKWYEGWRTSRLKRRGAGPAAIRGVPDARSTSTSVSQPMRDPDSRANGYARVAPNEIGVAVADGSPPPGNKYQSGVAY